MKKRDRIAVQKQIQVEFPDLEIIGTIMAINPRGHLLSGLCFEPSGYIPDVLYITSFVMPLFVPCDHITLGLGERIRTIKNEELWDPRSKPVMTELLARINSSVISTIRINNELKGYVRNLEKAKSANINNHESLGYAYVLSGDYPAAFRVFEGIKKNADPTVLWQKALLGRVQTINQLLEKNPVEAEVLLSQWEAETKGNLRLNNKWG